jgi:hypothetical protein
LGILFLELETEEGKKRMQIIVAASGPKYFGSDDSSLYTSSNTFLFNFNLRSRGMKGIEHTHKRRRRRRGRRVEKYPSEKNGIRVCRHVVGNVPGVTRAEN